MSGRYEPESSRWPHGQRLFFIPLQHYLSQQPYIRLRSNDFMSLTASSLRDLHRIHQQQTELTDRLAAGPIRIKAAEAAVLQLQQSVERITDTRGKLNTCATNKEFQALKDQIDTDLQENDLLEDKILKLLEGLDEHEERVKASEQELNDASQELKKIRDAVETSQAGLETDLEQIQEQLTAAEASLPGDLRSDYKRIAQSMGEDALAGVEEDVCGGCFQKLTPQTINELLVSKPVFCKSCGRLLYMLGDADTETAE